jgi:trans-2-enoyl-CoA reductase
VRAGDWIAVNAATSSIARLVHGLCRGRRVSVLGIVGPSREAPRDFPVVPDAGVGLSERVLAATGGAPIAGLLDSVGGGAITGMLNALRPGATIVSFGALTRDPAALTNADIIYRNLTWKGFGLDRWLMNSTGRRARMLENVWTAIRDGDVTLPVRARYRLDELGLALADAARQGQSGKVLFVQR